MAERVTDAQVPERISNIRDQLKLLADYL